MRYLGGMTGSGTLLSAGVEIGEAGYDIDAYFRKPIGLTGCGEIRAPAAILRSLFGRRDVQLRMSDGRRVGITFTQKDLKADAVSAHVDVAGLPDSLAG